MRLWIGGRGGWLLAAALSVAIASPAWAQEQTKDQQKCTNALNKDMQKLSAAQGKEIAGCLKNASKGKTEALGPGGTFSSCISADLKGKVAGAQAKTQADFDKSCVGLSKTGEPKLPPYGPTDVEAVNQSAILKELSLISDLLGSDLDSAVILESADKNAAKCQQALVKAVKKCQDTRLKEFNKCKKDGLKSVSGAPPVITSVGGLADCLGADAKGKIAVACDDAGKPDGIRKGIQKSCVDKSVDLSDAIPGCDTDDPAALHACLSEAIVCRTHSALSMADAIPGWHCGSQAIGDKHCEFDVTSVCTAGTREGLPCSDTVLHSDCPPGPGGNPRSFCLGPTWVYLDRSINGTQTRTITFGFTGGSVGFDCGVPSPVTGVASCDCELIESDPIVLPIIGTACVSAIEAGCASGKIDCNGGEPADQDIQKIHDVGNCGLSDDPNQDRELNTGPDECEALCDAECASRGGGFRVLRFGCEGYCRDGSLDGKVCNFDTECADAECVGGDPVAHDKTCQCECIEVAGSPGRPGALSCEIGLSTAVEVAPPCFPVDHIDDITLRVGGQCVPFSSELNSTTITEVNKLGYTIGPDAFTGAPRLCAELALDHLTELAITGNVASFDSALGDLTIPVQIQCQ